MFFASTNSQRRLTSVTATAAALCALAIWLSAGPSAAQQAPGPGFSPPPDDDTGFRAIFDGTSLKDWDGDPRFWRVEGGVIVGETTTDNPVEQNTFLIWRGGEPKDFELKLEYRLTEGNSGIQYRSAEASDARKWGMKGYQADMDGQDRYTGQLYEEGGRGFLSMRGQFTRVAGAGAVKLLGSIGDIEELKAPIRGGDWNHYHVIARGNVLIHAINGHVMSVVVDDDEQNRAAWGFVGLQLHRGPPMKAEFRNILLRGM